MWCIIKERFVWRPRNWRRVTVPYIRLAGRELGLKGKADVAQFEAQVAADDYTLTHQQNLFNTALLTLRECMNYPSDLELEVDTLLPDINYVPEVENVAEIFAYASGNNPTALQAEYQLTQSKYQYRIYKGKDCCRALFELPGILYRGYF